MRPTLSTVSALAVALALPACHEQGQTHLARGNVLQNQGKVAEAIVEYQAAAQADPAISAPWLRMGDLYYGEGQREPAKAAYRQATARNPAQIEAWIGIARIESDEGHDREARASLGRALAVRPKNLYSRLSRAELALRDGDPTSALEDAKVADELDDKDPQVLFVYGSAMAGAGDEAGAKAAFDRIASLDPKSPLAAYGLAKLELAKGDKLAAVEALRRALALAPAQRTELSQDPALAALRGDPSFDALVGGSGGAQPAPTPSPSNGG
ncbi:MAG: tetratricopeptide repeat protein [Deltaproteobacteria bacterium]